MPVLHVAGEGLMVAEAGDHLGVGEHLGEGLEDKAGRGEVVFSENIKSLLTKKYQVCVYRDWSHTSWAG